MFFLGCIYGTSSVTSSLSSNKNPLRLTVYPIKHTQGNANKKLALYIIHEENHQIYSSIIHKIGSKNICNTENFLKKIIQNHNKLCHTSGNVMEGENVK